MNKSTCFIGFLAIALTFSSCAPKMRAAPIITASSDKEKVERGKYLVESVAACIDCHSERDVTKQGAPSVSGREYVGGMIHDENEKLNGEEFPGTVQGPNITQDKEDGIGAWTDGEIIRAIREGVDKDNNALFMMPYDQYRNMSDSDALAIVSYLRTIQAKKNKTVATSLKFPVNLFVNFMPEPLEGKVDDPKEDQISKGKYLVSMGNCIFCHTESKKGKIITDKAFSGGVVFENPNFSVISTNITPDMETGIGNISEEKWLKVFREGKGFDGRDLNPVMPWIFYKGMSDSDLLAIYAYLKTVKPINSTI